MLIPYEVSNSVGVKRMKLDQLLKFHFRYFTLTEEQKNRYKNIFGNFGWLPRKKYHEAVCFIKECNKKEG